jgi:hypothetical protein
VSAQGDERERLRTLLKSRRWRLNNLYRIEDKDGNDVPFRMNAVQQAVDESLWHRNAILKSRQHGITTWACIRSLDTALFRPHTACGVVAHTKEDADKFFRQKIHYAYERLPDWLKDARRIKRYDGNGEMVLSNDSRIVVGVSLRSGTYQRLHVSELGKMDETDPRRANEVVAGALNTVPTDGIATIESTARVAAGQFYAMVQRAMRYDRMLKAGTVKELTPLDYKFFFLPWMEDPTAVMDVPTLLSPELIEYFERIQAETGLTLTDPQKWWYAKKQEEQGEQMYMEFPSTPEEAFWVSSEAAYYAKLIAKAEMEGRICNLPFIPGIPVNTFWDIGRSDATAIWFHQQVGPWHHFIDYYENSGEQASHYATELQRRQASRGYVYGKHYLPHDAGNTDWSAGENRTRAEILEDLGVKPQIVIPRIQVLADGIDMVRQVLPKCRFDRVRCGENPPGSGRGGLPALRFYRKAFNEKAQVFSNDPMKSWANHGADAFRQFPQGYETAIPRKPRDDDSRRGAQAPRWVGA